MVSPEKLFRGHDNVCDEWAVFLPTPHAKRRGSVVRGESAVIVVNAVGDGNDPIWFGAAVLRFRNNSRCVRTGVAALQQSLENR